MVAVKESQKNAVSLRGLQKGFGSGNTRIEVLHGIDLEANTGEILMLVGPSGCGKTTLLTLIAGLLDPDKGSIQVFGSDIERMSSGQKTTFRRANIGFVFQQFNLIPTLTAAENAAVPLLIQDVPRKEAVARAKSVLAQVELSHRTDSYPAQLSGGEQQRVAVARALVSKPRLLICDEPTASLDGETGEKVMETIRTVGLTPDRCMIIVTHDSRIFRFGDRIARMVDGRILSVEKQKSAVSS
jgi:putative ABC transport system ATP-binding protein